MFFFLVSQNHYGNFILRVFYFGSVDYKSIALPAELQGLNEYLLIFFKLIKLFFSFHYMMKYNSCTIRYI